MRRLLVSDSRLWMTDCDCSGRSDDDAEQYNLEDGYGNLTVLPRRENEAADMASQRLAGCHATILPRRNHAAHLQNRLPTIGFFPYNAWGACK